MPRFHPVAKRRQNHAGSIKCAVCNKLSPSPRRCPLAGAYMCPKHALFIRHRIRKRIETDPMLARHMHNFGPKFLHYVNPKVFGINYHTTVTVYQPTGAIPLQKRRPQNLSVIVCNQCGDVIIGHARRGVDPNTIFCNACGLSIRRELQRLNTLDKRFKVYFDKNIDCSLYLRPEVLRWLGLLK